MTLEYSGVGVGMERALSLETQLAPLAQAPGVEYRTNCQPEKPGKIGQTRRTEGQVAKKVMETSRRVRAMTVHSRLLATVYALGDSARVPLGGASFTQVYH